MKVTYITVSNRGIFKEVRTTPAQLEKTIKELKEAGYIRSRADYYIIETEQESKA